MGGLLAAGRPLPAGWERGVTFGDGWCLDPAPWPYCLPDVSPPPSPGTKQAETIGTAEFEPLGLYQAVECTTLARDVAQEEAAETLAATGEYLIGSELQTGAQTGNPSLADAVPVANAGTGITGAIGTADKEISQALKGRLGYVHVDPFDLATAIDAGVLVRDGRTWRTPMGHTVVSSPGYDFEGTVYATPEVFVAVSATETRTDIDRAINQTVAYAEALGLAVFPPCFNISINVEGS